MGGAGDEDGRETRTYVSPLREAQARLTREQILEAFAAIIVEENPMEFSMQRLAERAAVSVRTIYRHFATREDLIDGLATYWEGLPHPPMPETLSDIAEMIPELYRHFESYAPIVEALWVTQLGREVNDRARAARNARIRARYAPLFEDLAPESGLRALAVSRTMFGSHAWRTLRNEFGMTTEQAAETVRWVARLVFDDVQRQLDAARAAEPPTHAPDPTPDEEEP